MIVFAAGYNMKRKKFFSNIGMIMLFGLGSTVVCFIFFCLITYFFNSKGLLTKWDNDTKKYVPFELSIMEILLMCSLMCASDVIAALTIVDHKKQPKLASILFGEGVTNDAVSIILFNSVLKMQKTKFTASTPIHILMNFLSLTCFSVLAGMGFALFSSMIFKRYRFLSRHAITECALIFCFGYSSYFASERLGLSGIISLLTCGIIMAQYTWHNLSP